MNFRFYTIVVCAMIVSAVCNAQDALTGAITLRDAVEATLQNNPRLRSFPLRIEASLGERESAGLNPAWEIGAGLENALGTGQVSDFTGAEATLSLSSVVEMGEKRAARIGLVDRRIDLLNTEQKIIELDLLIEVVRRFIDVASAQEYLGLQSQSSAIAGQTVNALQPLVEAGQTPQLELDRARAALLRAQVAEQSAISRLESARIRLASMWGSNSPEFDSVVSDLLTVGQAGSVDSVLAALTSNPDIELYAAESRLLEAELRLAQSQQKSDVKWSAGIRHLKDIDDTAIAVEVSIPLFSRTRNSGVARTARANLQDVEIRRLTAVNNIEGEIRSLFQALQQAISETNILQQQVIPALQQVQLQTQAAYAAGNYSYVELISAQREYLDAQLALISSAGNAHRLRAEIERLSGLPFSGQ